MSGYPDSSPDSKALVWVSGLFCPDTQTPTCLTIRTFLSPDTKVGLGIRSPDTETPVYKAQAFMDEILEDLLLLLNKIVCPFNKLNSLNYSLLTTLQR